MITPQSESLGPHRAMTAATTPPLPNWRSSFGEREKDERWRKGRISHGKCGGRWSGHPHITYFRMETTLSELLLLQLLCLLLPVFSLLLPLLSGWCCQLPPPSSPSSSCDRFYRAQRRREEEEEEEESRQREEEEQEEPLLLSSGKFDKGRKRKKNLCSTN